MGSERPIWRALRLAVTHAHTRATLDPLLADADRWAADLPADQVLRQISSPFAPDDDERATAPTLLTPPPALAPAA